MFIGFERSYVTVPTLDTERNAPFSLGRNWSASNIQIFGHSINVDIPTGNLFISTTDEAYPYYSFSLGITRKYDLQEQYMQLTYLRNYPNVNPKPHWFGNWQFAYEADVDEVWLKSFPEVHVTSGVGANGLFRMDQPDFKRNFQSQVETENLLRTYGIPKQTLDQDTGIDWQFTKNDFLLRTKRGRFQILAGHFQDETLVDDIDTKLWLFNPITGTTFYVSSDYFFNNLTDQYREVGYPLLVTKLVDALGHKIELQPTSTTPPYTEYILFDDSDLPAELGGTKRKFTLKLEEELTYLDGLNWGGKVRKNFVNQVIDHTKTTHNTFTYKYAFQHYGSSDFPLLKEVEFPCSISNGTRKITYHYDAPDHPGVLTAIENYEGNEIQFEYEEDPLDNDERLNPRLKVKRIIVPKSITFEYKYDHSNGTVVVTLFQNDQPDRKAKYTYIRDIRDTKKRYITVTETEVTRGYVDDGSGNLIPRLVNNPQTIRNITDYSTDERFNVSRILDPLNRMIRFQYNDFNQIKKVWDFDDHWTENIYDIPSPDNPDNPSNPSPSNPRCYDLLEEKKQNLIRVIDSSTASGFREDEMVINKIFTYKKYDNTSSASSLDREIQSTHRIHTETDERGKVWTCTYADALNHKSLSPTLIESPLGFKTSATYNDRGERVTVTDDEGNLHQYHYSTRGQIEKYEDPNGGTILQEYYQCGNWLNQLKDQLFYTTGKFTDIERYPDGKIKKITDPKNDAIDYEYFSNNRLKIIKEHRPAFNFLSGNPAETKDFPDLITEFGYSPLGKLTSLKNPKGLVLRYEFDEVGRLIHWFHNLATAKKTKYRYDEVGQLKQLEDKSGQTTTYSYTNMGFVQLLQYPPWNEGSINHIGKKVEYQAYDYLGRIFTIDDNEIGKKEVIYDEIGNLTNRFDPNGFEMEFQYDDNNRLEYVKDSNTDFILDIRLDSLGRPETILDSSIWDGSITWNYKYEKINGIKKVLNLYEIENSNINLKTTFDYDEKNRLMNLKHEWTNSSATQIYQRTFNYREDDLLEQITGDDPNSFNYDKIKQLIYENFGNMIFDYDEAGNRKLKISLGALTATTPENDYNVINQLEKEKILDAEFEYDDKGNISTIKYPSNPSEDQEFYFEGFNKLRVYKKGNLEIRYNYNSAGQLHERQLIDNSSTPPSKEITTFNYLLNKPIVLKHNNNLFLIATWDPYGRLLRIRRDQQIGAGVLPNSLFPLYDGQGDIVRFVDQDKNEPVAISYNAWGESTIIGPSNLLDFWGYRGGILDRKTRLILFGARWYSPKFGRWISEDPLVEPDPRGCRRLSNLYSYVLNNPIAFLDPTGLTEETTVEVEDYYFGGFALRIGAEYLAEAASGAGSILNLYQVEGGGQALALEAAGTNIYKSAFARWMNWAYRETLTKLSLQEAKLGSRLYAAAGGFLGKTLKLWGPRVAEAGTMAIKTEFPAYMVGRVFGGIFRVLFSAPVAFMHVTLTSSEIALEPQNPEEIHDFSIWD